MSKIREIITEPSKMYAGETFKIKIKAIRYLLYSEIKEQKVNKLKEFTVSQMKGG